MAEYIENPLSGKLRGVTYEDGKIIDVHIRDTDGVVKVFVPMASEKEAKTMREILFRGKRLDNGEWVYGSFVQVEHDDGSFTTAIFQKKDAGGDAEVFPATVGQYTGLKDKHGKRIFEGDIVVFSRGRNLPNSACLPELIKYHQGDCAYQRYPLGRCVDRGGGGRLIQPDMMVSCELFGNIHDNPELLDASRCLECLKGAKNKSCPIYKEGCSCGTQDDIKCLQQPAK